MGGAAREARSGASLDLERGIGLLITAGTYLSVIVVGIGVGAMTVADRSPLESGFAPFDPARLLPDLAAGRAEGFLWLGLIIAIATPAARVAAALVGFVVRGERVFAAVAAVILALIAGGVVLVLATG